MKLKSLLAIIVFGASATLTSCENSSKLADSIAGTWSGAPEKLIDNNSSAATITETYTFMHDKASNGGDVIVTALISVTGAVSGTEAFIQPFSIAAAATAQISGTWEAKSDNKIAFEWNDSTLVVNVDPQAVTLSANLLTNSESPSVESLKPQFAESIKAQVAQAVEVKFLAVRKFDSIKFNDRIMEYKVNDENHQMVKQGITE